MSRNSGSLRKPRTYETTLATQAVTNEPSLLVQTAEIRDEVDDLSNRAVVLHDGQQVSTLNSRASEVSQEDAADILATLSEDFGFSWPLIADLVGVSTSALRKWRRGGPATPKNRYSLALVVAFCELLRVVNPRITDPSHWLEIPVTPETTLRNGDIFSRGSLAELLDVASGRMTSADMLTSLIPGWRIQFAPSEKFDIVLAPDGLPSIVSKNAGK